VSFFLLCYEPIHTHSFNASINSSAHSSLWLQTDSCSSSTAFGGTKLTPDRAATWHLEKTNLELPFLPHFLNLLIQRGSRFLGRKTKARCCERRPEERVAIPPRPQGSPCRGAAAALPPRRPPRRPPPRRRRKRHWSPLPPLPAARGPAPAAPPATTPVSRPSRTEPASHHPSRTGLALPLHPQSLPTRAPRAPRPPPRWCPPAPGRAACPPLPGTAQHRVAPQQRMRSGAARGGGSGCSSLSGKGNWKRRGGGGYWISPFGTQLLLTGKEISLHLYSTLYGYIDRPSVLLVKPLQPPHSLLLKSKLEVWKGLCDLNYFCK